MFIAPAAAGVPNVLPYIEQFFMVAVELQSPTIVHSWAHSTVSNAALSAFVTVHTWLKNLALVIGTWTPATGAVGVAAGPVGQTVPVVDFSLKHTSCFKNALPSVASPTVTECNFVAVASLGTTRIVAVNESVFVAVSFTLIFAFVPTV